MKKILCLHGYRQNAGVFKDKTGSLRKLLKKHAELTYISAPHIIPAVANNSNTSDKDEPISNEEQRAWYFSTEALTFNSHDVTECCVGLHESIEVLRKAFCELGPFDGILGFSQGAALSAVLCNLQEKGELGFSFKFAILVSGFRSKLNPLNIYYDTILATPTLHVIGDSDRIVEKEMSEELLSYFQQPHKLQHTGGHYVPATSKEKAGYVTFIESVV